MNKTMTCQLSALLIFTFLGTSAFAQSKPASDWNAILEAAKREGMVKCACPPRREFARRVQERFRRRLSRNYRRNHRGGLPAFPSPSCQGASAKMFLWDVYTFGPGAEIFDLKEQGRLGIPVGLYQLYPKCSMTPRGSAASRIVFSMSNRSIFSACFSPCPPDRLTEMSYPTSR